MTIYKGALIAGVIYLVLGVAFLLEALDLWAFELGDLRLVGPSHCYWSVLGWLPVP